MKGQRKTKRNQKNRSREKRGSNKRQCEEWKKLD